MIAQNFIRLAGEIIERLENPIDDEWWEDIAPLTLELERIRQVACVWPRLENQPKEVCIIPPCVDPATLPADHPNREWCEATYQKWQQKTNSGDGYHGRPLKIDPVGFPALLVFCTSRIHARPDIVPQWVWDDLPDGFRSAWYMVISDPMTATCQVFFVAGVENDGTTVDIGKGQERIPIKSLRRWLRAVGKQQTNQGDIDQDERQYEAAATNIQYLGVTVLGEQISRDGKTCLLKGNRLRFTLELLAAGEQGLPRRVLFSAVWPDAVDENNFDKTKRAVNKNLKKLGLVVAARTRGIWRLEANPT